MPERVMTTGVAPGLLSVTVPSYLPTPVTVAVGAETLLRLLGKHRRTGAALLLAVLLVFCFIAIKRFNYDNVAEIAT